ncbi:M10 family metallopeptidase C-terminal domain-containing protein [Rhizobium sp. KVB221]|uniref:M10 family metallopeptidase C-terminal domain-containing protein n=1 Tax=Rhizobium setariae TaxID=2801340 RepID=A0A936YML7_9HYPH|nr:M10 family metallopeptidase C-terminal domain-containing protein [Rhizobium setariae]
MLGSSGADALMGGAGRDVVIGQGGRDVLTGDSGADWFVFSKASDSRMGAQDRIADFRPGTDKIVLSKLMDGLAPDLLDKGEAFHSIAGEIRWTQTRTETKIEIDMNGDGVADLGITLDGRLTLSDRDFLL